MASVFVIKPTSWSSSELPAMSARRYSYKDAGS